MEWARILAYITGTVNQELLLRNGYDRIVGALANLGYTLLDETVGNILRRNGIPQPQS